MKTLIINGSPHKNGNTSFLANLLSKKLKGETDIIFLSDINFKSCCDCESCKKNSLCVLDDDAQDIINSLNNYDNIVLATPLYYNQPTGDDVLFIPFPVVVFKSKFKGKSQESRYNCSRWWRLRCKFS